VFYGDHIADLPLEWVSGITRISLDAQNQNLYLAVWTSQSVSLNIQDVNHNIRGQHTKRKVFRYLFSLA